MDEIEMTPVPVDPEPEGASRDRTLPSFLVIGAMRSGTTSLNRYLDAHPEVCMGRVKEIHFFDRNFDEGVEWYSSHFERQHTHRAVGEATPDYMFDPLVPQRVREVLPGSRLIAILRNPVDRAYSHYWQKRSYGKEPLEFEEAVEAEPERLAQGGRSRTQYSYLARGHYFEQLKRFEAHFPRTEIGMFLFEDMLDQPVETFRRICRFIGVSEFLTPSLVGNAVNAYQEYRSPWLRNASRALPSSLRKVVGKLNAKPAAYPPMDPAIRKRLLSVFEDSNRALAEWAALDLSAWKR